jgi:hypothetical protein
MRSAARGAQIKAESALSESRGLLRIAESDVFRLKQSEAALAEALLVADRALERARSSRLESKADARRIIEKIEATSEAIAASPIPPLPGIAKTDEEKVEAKRLKRLQLKLALLGDALGRIPAAARIEALEEMEAL